MNCINTRYYGYARVALLFGLSCLEIKVHDNVLLPAFICNSVISPFNHLGIDIKYYDVEEDLSPDYQQIHKLIDNNTRAILVPNYFGFPQDYRMIRGLCKERSIFYIEDNAHGFMGQHEGSPLGIHGDISITSFRKNFRMMNGAALVLNNNDIRPPSIDFKLRGENPVNIARDIYNYFSTRYPALDIRRWLRALHLRDELKAMFREEGSIEEVNIERYLVRMSFAVKILVRQLSTKNFAKRCINNYLYLSKYLAQNKLGRPIFDSLPEGIVPYAFPIRTKERLRMAEYLLSYNIPSYPWPDLPALIAGSGEARSLYKEVLLVPLSGKISMGAGS